MANHPSQDDVDVLFQEIIRQDESIQKLIEFNRQIVVALNNVWTILDRLTGRKPDIARPAHVHTWTFIQPATYVNGDRNAIGFGVTERCDCGEVRTRATSWISSEELVA